jgi:leucyl/phenylalanyl-tRNA--protein transferase
MIIRPEEFRPSRSLRKVYTKSDYRLSMDEDFDAVVRQCALVPRRGQDGTWITEDMITAYISLHRSGIGHSVECWDGDKLVGGLYGLSIGDCFFGESMFSKQSDVSKIAFWALMQYSEAAGIKLVDCQIYNDHLASLGAYPVARIEFLRRLNQDVQADTRVGPWTQQFETAMASGLISRR